MSMRALRACLLCISLCVLALPALAAAVPSMLSVRAEEGKEIITLSLPTQAPLKVFTLADPHRVVVDAPTLENPNLSLPKDYSGTLISGFRYASFSPTVTRLVFELVAAPASIKTESAATAGGTELVITLSSPKAGVKDKRPLVVIDAGHGGQDPGTTAARGTREKDVVFAMAVALRDALVATKRYRVELTRADDRLIPLRERFAIARRAKADVFISLHADSASEKSARGLSLYTLSEKASDAEAEALAAQENKVDEVYGLDLSGQSEDVADILTSLAQRDTNQRSAVLATALLGQVKKGGVRLLPNPHRFAGFAVLKAPDIPSVLIETGFLSHPEDEKLLTTRAYRDKVTKALVKGLDAYFARPSLGAGAVAPMR